ncbi:nitrate transporter [Pseudomassariella vexata]|uniref:Nitrate/nitrite transporter n=1 Tax=Pseudomassariella vexata TaxID=1141098 RepID=A0A1Y2DSQ4_9PEZI|nr:nitrate transporter [Pseudomassariella vexata]ORY62194.1 nitrate transporter [Pseudomassariella vexata]
MLKFSHLYHSPEINPISRKARSIPFLNPVNVYGRVFFFSWFGFMVAFWAWYAFPPLLTHTIKANLHLTPAEVANSNIVSLVATLFIRVLAGPLCDMFGPRLVFGGLLLVGSIPLGLAPLVHNASGLYVSRFFIGILGGSFVPCQVWSTGFFDKNVVGTANALTGGWGNAGGGITYFIMPAVFDSFVARGYNTGTSWRIAFIVPLVVVIVTGVSLIVFCPDTPTGKWSGRHLHAIENLHRHEVDNSGVLMDIPDSVADKVSSHGTIPSYEHEQEKKPKPEHEAVLSKDEMLQTANGEVVAKPSFGEALKVFVCPQTFFHMVTYFCSFGAELAINSILSAYYVKNFPALGQTNASTWAAMFGFLNFVTRPLGGVIGDIVYRMTSRNVWAKKIWIVLCGCITGVMLIIIGKVNPHSQSTMFGLIALMAVFLEAGNGANFALVPHVHPHANGIISGCIGAVGNLGGVVFAVIFRFTDAGTNYAKAFWIIGIIHVAMNLVLSWVPPLPKGQIGGH